MIFGRHEPLARGAGLSEISVFSYTGAGPRDDNLVKGFRASERPGVTTG